MVRYRLADIWPEGSEKVRPEDKWERACQAEGTASAKALRWKYTLHGQKISRMLVCLEWRGAVWGDEVCATNQHLSLGISDLRQCFPQHTPCSGSIGTPDPLGIMPLAAPLSILLLLTFVNLQMFSSFIGDSWSPLHPNPVITRGYFVAV